MWERACSRKGRDIQHKYRLIRRIREQARSHRKTKARQGANLGGLFRIRGFRTRPCNRACPLQRRYDAAAHRWW
ncbi:hypothetical protein PspCFBP13508_13010 [Pseudomonas sp. CFBP13508]|nr:hypothetical protein PspCFBP13508_13010 [Pseudomonas sp. CFBP13508]